MRGLVLEFSEEIKLEGYYSLHNICIYYKEMTLMIMQAGKSQDFQDKTQAGHPGEPSVQFQFKDRQAQEQERADVSVQL